MSLLSVLRKGRSNPIRRAVAAAVENLEARTLFAAAPAGFEQIATLTVDGTTGAHVIHDGIYLEAGKQYFYIASGTHQIAENPLRLADAQFYQNTNLAWVKGSGPHLHANGVNWWAAVTGEANTFTKLVTGGGTFLETWISDSYFGDNDGSLTLEVFRQEEASAPNVTVTSTSDPASELGPISQTFTFTRSGDRTLDLTVRYELGGSATVVDDFVVSGENFNNVATATERYVTIKAGDDSASVTITPETDTDPNEEEYVSATVLEPSGSSSQYDGTGVAVIEIEDAPLSIMAVDDEVDAAAELQRASYRVATGGTLSISEADGVMGNDYYSGEGTVTIPSNTDPSNGTLTLASDGSFVYVPNAGFVGIDSFTYVITDGTDTSSSATVSLEVIASEELTLAIGNWPPGDPDAEISLAEDDASNLTAMSLGFSDELPSGTILQLVLDSGFTNVAVWTDPFMTGGSLIIGGSAGSSYSWSIGSLDSPPHTVWLQGLEESEYGAVQFTLTATMPSESPGGGSPAGPTTAPSPATQPATVKAPAPLIIGFYGADGPLADMGGGLNLGNQEMDAIGADVKVHKMYHWNKWKGAFNDILKILDTNGDGRYDPVNALTDAKGKDHAPDTKRSLRMFGHSWGAVSSFLLAQKIDKSDKFVDDTIDILASIDPVNTARNDFGGVPSNVKLFWNRYRSKGGAVEVAVIGVKPSGYAPASAAQADDPGNVDLNPTGNAAETDKFLRGPYQAGVAYEIDHFNIIGVVRADLTALLTAP